LIEFDLGIVFTEFDGRQLLYTITRLIKGDLSVGGGCWLGMRHSYTSGSESSMGKIFHPFAPGIIGQGDTLTVEICDEQFALDPGSWAMDDIHERNGAVRVVIFYWNGVRIPQPPYWRHRRVPDHLLNNYHLYMSIKTQPNIFSNASIGVLDVSLKKKLHT